MRKRCQNDNSTQSRGNSLLIEEENQISGDVNTLGNESSELLHRCCRYKNDWPLKCNQDSCLDKEHSIPLPSLITFKGK